ncbi:hypothetical protein [Azoarcus sp. KH32C]|uniref:hypothetical protein n=1 Tax=Azoarcus sp. KH32C TaxID=748247 RepID=UPI001E4FD03D|nr:hypothetical protein [Azoarcus sp. KH32C]
MTLPSTLSAAPTVSGGSFDQQTQAIDEGMKAKEDSGVFGRPGFTGDEGPRASSSVGDRDMDRYVQRLGYEIRLRNAMQDRDSAGFR